MKTPRRSFVVEIKSKRRSPKTPTKSIWGDADLKALAQAVDDRVPHVFIPNEVSGRPDADGTVSHDPVDANSAGELPDEPGLAQTTPSQTDGTATDAPKQQQIVPTAADATEQVRSDQPEAQFQPTPVAVRIRAKRGPVHTTAKADPRRVKSARSETIGIVISPDDVTALDAENKRLKRLLAERLRGENLQLKKMLERFAAA